MRKFVLIFFILLTGFSHAQGHFVPAFVGKGQNHMAIYIIAATIGGTDIEVGDEIASFDGSICTGVVVLTQSIRSSDSDTFALIAASQKDVGSLNGYTTGNAITYKFWDKSKNKELSDIVATYIDANTNSPTAEPTYSPFRIALVKLSASALANQMPVANAGMDQSVDAGETVVLDGTASYDPDNDALTYLWTPPKGITLNSETTSKPTFTAPAVVADIDFTFSLIVNDGTLSSTTDQVIIKVKRIYEVPSIVSFSCAETSTSATVSVTVTTSNFNSISGYYLVADNSVTPSVDATGWLTSQPTSITLATEGSHTLYLWVKDVAGNVSAASTASVVYDKTAPVVSLSCAATIRDVTVPVVITSAETGSGISGYYLVADNSVTPLIDATGWVTSQPTSITLAAEGSHILYLWLKDVAGNISAASTASVVYDKTAPVASLSCAATTRDVPVSVVITSTETGSGISSYYLVADNSVTPSIDATGWVTSQPTSITLAAEGSHTLYLWVKDVAGNISNVSTVEVINNTTLNNAPEANAGLAQIVNEGQVISLDGSKSIDPDGDELSYSWTAPVGIILSDTNIANPTFVAPQVTSKTDFIFTLKVTDAFSKSATSSVTVTVNDLATFSLLSLKNGSFLTAYPNPFDNQITIEMFDEDEKIGPAYIYNNSGILMYELQKLLVYNRKLKFNWDGKDRYGKPVPAGLYVLKINNHILRLIKN